MRIEILYFAAAREAAGVPGETLEIADDATVDALRATLDARHPGLSRVSRTARFAVGERFAPASQRLASGDVVALLPPVSGG